MDLEIRRFQEMLVRSINHNALPAEIKRLVVQDILYQLEEASKEAIKNQLQEEKSNAEESESEE